MAYFKTVTEGLTGQAERPARPELRGHTPYPRDKACELVIGAPRRLQVERGFSPRADTLPMQGNAMCGRYDSLADLNVAADAFAAELSFDRTSWTATSDVRPTTRQPVLLADKTVVLARWGWKPIWMKSGVLINSKSEEAATKRTFSKAFATRRCVVIASAFYEWRSEAGKKIRVRFTLRGTPCVAMAGIWADEATEGGAEQERKFVIMTTRPNALVEPVHNRMPVLLKHQQVGEWLNPQTPAEHVTALCDPIAASAMESIDAPEVKGPKGRISVA